MEFCHFLFFLVKKEHKKDVKCKAFTTTKLELRKDKEPKKLQYEKYRIFQKNYQVYQCFKYSFSSSGIKSTHTNVRGRKKTTCNDK